MRIAFVGALFAGLAAPAFAQNEHEDLVAYLLDSAGELAGQSGYGPELLRSTGALAGGTQESVTLNLAANQDYFIVAQCDGDCSDLDLSLYDNNDNLIDEDVLEDDSPIVTVTPMRNGSFTLNVSMISCAQDPCYYGVSVFAR